MQIGYVIFFINAFHKKNIIYWSSIKYKKVIKSILALELYAMVHGFDGGAIIKLTIEEILNIRFLPMIICTNSKLLYNCLMKLDGTREKQLIINLIYL